MGRSIDRRHELRLFATLGAPNALMAASRLAQLLTDQAVLGHLSSEYLDASSLALLWMNLTMQMCVRGLKGAVNTLVSQAIGAGNDELAGLWLRVAYMLAPVFSAFVVGMWLLAGPVLTLVVASGAAGGEAGSGGDDGRAAACDLAARYTRLSIGWVLPTMVLEATSSYLLARRGAMPQLLVYSCFFLVNLGLNVLFVHGGGGWAGLGFDGSPIATTATRVGQLLSLLAVLRLRGVALPWRGCSIRATQLRTFVGQALPQTMGAALEELTLQAAGALAGRLGEVAMATHQCMLMAFFWLTSPMYGLIGAVQIRIGHYLGASNPRAARAVGVLCLQCALTISVLVAALLVALRDQVGWIFSGDPKVVAMTSSIAPLVGGAYTLIGLFYASMACLNGQGRPLAVAVSFLCGAFLITPVSGYLLAFVARCCGDTQLFGLWFGLICGYMVTTLISMVAVARSDWGALAKTAISRAERAPPSGVDEAAPPGEEALLDAQQAADARVN